MPLPLRARGGRWDSWIQPACNSDPRTHCHDMTPAQGDIGTAKRAQIAKAALALNRHDDIILSTSAGIYHHRTSRNRAHHPRRL